MKLLEEVAAGVLRRLDDMEIGARMLLSELDGLDDRLHRAFTAVSIDNWVAYLNVERNRMLSDERQAKANASLMRLPALGIYGLVFLSSGRKPNWKHAVTSVFREEPFEDVRVAVSLNDTKLVNVSGIARRRRMTVDQAIKCLEWKGYTVLNWPEFVVKADNLGKADLKSEAEHSGI
ncbi:MAG: hypothetical protein ACLFVA_05370 [Dehalococcoidia bacterium]